MQQEKFSRFQLILLVLLYLWFDKLPAIGVYAQITPICGEVPFGLFVRGSGCQMYNYCANGIAYPGKCPNNQYFNSQSQLCDNAIGVDCTMCSRWGVQLIADPTNCRRYYRCVSGVRTQRICPVGLRFDENVGNCNFESLVPCNLEQTICSPFGHSGTVHIGHPNNCQSYFICFNGVGNQYHCNNNGYYNSHTGFCGDSPINCQGTGDILQVVPPAITTTTPAPQTFRPQCSSYINLGRVYISNPYNCSSYFSCNNGTLTNHECPRNQSYNAYTTLCGSFCEGSGQVVVQTPPPGTSTTASGTTTTRSSATTTTRSSATTTTRSSATTTTRASATTTATTRASATTTATTRASATTTATTRAAATTTTRAAAATTANNSATGDPRCLKAAGYFPIAGSCTQYVYCIRSEVRFEFTCPDGEYYSVDYELCKTDKPNGC